MATLYPIDAPFALEGLANQIRKSSNFRFNWQFYKSERACPQSENGILEAAEYIIGDPQCHLFLRDSFDAMYDDEFEIEEIHPHARFQPADGEFSEILASAANDHLGAYSKNLRNATQREKNTVSELFSGYGDFVPFQLMPGEIEGCRDCSDHNNHLFTNWFYGVAWDWCFAATWPQRKTLWLGCLTDTD